MSSSGESAKGAIALIMFGSVFLYRALRTFRKARRMRDSARIDIHSAAQGLVEVEGFAWPASLPIETIYGRSAVLYHYKVQAWEKKNRSSSWVTIHDVKNIVPFFVVDHSGFCLVDPTTLNTDLGEFDPRGRELDLAELISPLSDAVSDLEDLKKSIAAKKAFGWFQNVFARRYRLVEKILFVGSPVYVQGSLQASEEKVFNVPGDYQKFLRKLKAFDANPVFKMSQLDQNRDGKLSEFETKIGLSESAQGPAGAAIPVRVVGVIRATDSRELVIADCNEAQLLERISQFNALKIAGSLVMIALGLWLVLNRLSSSPISLSL